MRSVSRRALALAVLFFLSLPFLPSIHRADDSKNRSSWTGPYTLGAFVHKFIDGRLSCIEASIEQARKIKGRDPNLPLIDLAPDSNSPAAQERNLKIDLRGTSQLQNFPGAVEAFKRAAAQWESLIRTDVTIIIDVDFGPTLFGEQFDSDEVCGTDSQVLGGNSLYPAVRANLISETFAPEKVSFYNSLPLSAAPTDVGDSSGVTASSATLRALGLIDRAADPDGELNSFGPPPAIGLNSKFGFDFDPNDGIDRDKLDFESIALHEIGHVLGFVSFVGQQEINSAVEVEPSVWDLFRFRPDGIKSDFSALQRILSSGGEQSFYAGGAKLALSTGAGGKQASHWKDDILTGQYTGVMDPTIEPGEHQFITDNDVSVLDAIGYKTRGIFDQTTIIPLISGRPRAGGIQTPPPSLGALSHTQYSIAVAQGATQLRIDLNGNQDVDLFVRFGQPVVIQGHNPKTDYMSTTGSSSEMITVTPSSSLPLRKGIYYISVANFGPGEADFTVTATVTGGIDKYPPAVFNLEANLEGDALRLDCTALDRDGDFAMADVSILDEMGRRVSSSSFAINSAGSTQLESRLAINGLSTIPSAARASLTLIDGSGNRSPEAILDFTKAQAGGLTVTGASFSQSKLTLSVRGVVADAELEINGRVVAPPRKIKVSTSGKKLTIKATANQLSLQPGANRIRVKNVNGWSNIVVLNI